MPVDALRTSGFIIRTEFSKGMAVFWRRNHRQCRRVPAGGLEGLCAVQLNQAGEKCRPVSVGMAWKRLWRKPTAMRDSLGSLHPEERASGDKGTRDT